MINYLTSNKCVKCGVKIPKSQTHCRECEILLLEKGVRVNGLRHV